MRTWILLCTLCARTCLAASAKPQCTHKKIITGSCEDVGMVSIELAGECQGAITTLDIKADFQSKEATESDLHGCWVDAEGTAGQFNSGGKTDSGGHFVTPYSAQFHGICKSKECGNDAEAVAGLDYYLQEITEDQYCGACSKEGYVLRKKGAECDSRDEELAPHKTCTVAECAKLCLEKEGCSYFIIGTGEIDGVDKTGHCFWEKTRNGCRDDEDRFKFNAYDFYALCRTAKQIYAEYQCKEEPAQIAAGQCKKRDEKDDNKQERSSVKADDTESEYHSYYYLKKTTTKKYCFDCERKGYVLRKKNAECSARDEELAPFKTCTVEECAKLCLDQEGCNYFIVGNGEINGVDKTGHCFWEKTTNGCKNKDDTFKHNAYDFYALCRPGENKAAEYQCKKDPPALKAAQCEDRKKPKSKKGVLKHESSSEEDDDDDSEYRDYYYLKKTSDKKYCYDCEQDGYVLRKRNAECSARDEELAPFKTCTAKECAQLCLKQEGCNYFIVGNGKINGVDKTGHCFWEKTTNGCKNKDDTFNHNAYDFYALCRPGEQKAAEFQCKKDPPALNAGKCEDRAKPEKGIRHEHSSKTEDEEETSYHDYYYLKETTDKKYCYDCEQDGYVLRKKNAECSAVDEELAPYKTCTVEECAKLCLDQEGCNYFIVGNGEINGVDKTGHCFWEKTTNGCKNKDDAFKHNAYNFYALCRPGENKAAEFQCKKDPPALKAAQCEDRKKPEKGLKQESSSEEDDKDDSEYRDYYYLKKTTDKKYCYDCQQQGYVLRKKNAECSAVDEELAPFKTCTVAECAQLCLEQEGCNYFIVGNGVIDGVDKTGHCFWEKTTNGCKNGDDKFNHNAYDFYALCREENDDDAEYQCSEAPHKLNAGQCDQRKDSGTEVERSSGAHDKKSPMKKYCFDCAKRGFVLREKGKVCDSSQEELAPGLSCTVAQCAQLCQQKDGCQYFAFGRESQKGHCIWQKTTNGCTGDDKFKTSEHDFFAVCNKANDDAAEFQCPKEPHKITKGECVEGEQRKHKAKKHVSDEANDSDEGSSDDNAAKKKESYSQYYKKSDGADTGDLDAVHLQQKTDEEPEQTNAGSVLLAISGVILGICIIGAIVIFAIRRYNSAKYDKASGTSAMGHVYGYGGDDKVDSYRDDDDDDEEISLKFADHPSDGSSAEDED